LTTHALDTAGAPQGSAGLTFVRYLDLAVLAIALPVFVIAGLPLLGYAVIAAAWLLQRAIQAFAARRAVATGDRRAAVGVLAGSLFGRLFLVCLSVLAAGLIEREAGLSGGILAAALFTVYFSTLLIVTPIEESRK
jgi:hypothetical protein